MDNASFGGTMLCGAIEDGTIEGSTIIGSARLHHLGSNIVDSDIDGDAIMGCLGADA